MDEKTFKIKEIFLHKGRHCVIVEMKWNDYIKRMTSRLQDSHHGYVESPNRIDYNDVQGEITADELTFSGELDLLPDFPDNLKDKWFFGFDSSHYWNDKQPESKTFESVKERTITLCDELIVNGC